MEPMDVVVMQCRAIQADTGSWWDVLALQRAVSAVVRAADGEVATLPRLRDDDAGIVGDCWDRAQRSVVACPVCDRGGCRACRGSGWVLGAE